MGVVDETQRQVRPRLLAAQGDERHRHDLGADTFCERGDGAGFRQHRCRVRRRGERLRVLGRRSRFIQDHARTLRLRDRREFRCKLEEQRTFPGVQVIEIRLQHDDVPLAPRFRQRGREFLLIAHSRGDVLDRVAPGWAPSTGFLFCNLLFFQLLLEQRDRGLHLRRIDRRLPDHIRCLQRPVVGQRAPAVDHRRDVEGQSRLAFFGECFDHSGKFVAGGEAVADEEHVQLAGLGGLNRICAETAQRQRDERARQGHHAIKQRAPPTRPG